jgi:arylsulfatase A-like enzyme
MRHLAIVCTALLGFCQHAAVGAEPSQPTHPNIVFILADDLGWRDLGCFGSTFYETPNVDRLAATGMKFTQAYAACPVCSPTRASILTGKYPQRVGITDYVSPNRSNQPEHWSRNTRLLPAPYADRLPLAETTLAEALKTGGYATFFAGKWHLGPEGFYPENQGFDINKGGCEWGAPSAGGRYFSPYGNPRLSDGPPGEHLPARLAAETAAFIAAHRDQPFLAYLSFYSVHTPLMAREDLRQKYEAKAKSVHPAGAIWGKEGDRKVRLVQDHAVYAAMVEAMDQAVGVVLGKLDELHLTERTVVIFMSDNGGLSTSEGWPTANVPLRAGKGWLYEGGIREPMIDHTSSGHHQAAEPVRHIGHQHRFLPDNPRARRTPVAARPTRRRPEPHAALARRSDRAASLVLALSALRQPRRQPRRSDPDGRLEAHRMVRRRPP